jgi:MFS family permease
MTGSPPKRLWNRNFMAYWAGSACAALGDAFLFVALPFLVLDLTGSARALATVVLLGTLPRFLGPLTGALADRLSLRVPLIVTGVARALLFAALALAAMADALPVWVVFGAALLNGTLTSFTFAAGMVLVPNLVPRPELARANSLMQAAFMGVPLLGLGLAGALVGSVGAGAAILVASPFLLALAVAATTMAFPAMDDRKGRMRILADTIEAGRYLLGSAPLAFVLVMSLVLNAALNLLNVAMPVLMERTGRGAQGYGLFESMLSTGLLLGILAVNVLARKVAPRYQISLAQVVMAAGFAVLAAGGFQAHLAGGLILGLGLGFSEVAAVTLLQLAVPDGMRGKVLGIIFTVNAVGLVAGAWLAGVLVERSTMSPIFLTGSATILLSALVWTVLHVRGRDDLERLIEATA